MFFSNAYDKIGVVLYVVKADSFEVIYINEAGKKEFGDITGKTCYKALNNSDSPCEGCGCKTQILADSQRISDGSEMIYTRARYLEGIGRYVDTYANPITLSSGETAWLCIALDVHSREVARLAGEESERKRQEMQHLVSLQQGFIQSAKSTMTATTLEGRMIFVNAAMSETLGYTQDEILNMAVQDFHPPEIAKAYFEQHIPEALEKGVWRGEAYMTRKDGSQFPIRQVIFPITNDNGEALALASIIDDITKIKEDQERLTAAIREAKEASSAKSNFLSRMSHEIRTPMNAILGMTKIGQGVEDPERIKYCFERIEVASKHLLGLINDILDMSKIEAGRLELSEEPFVLEKAIGDITDIISIKAIEKNQKLSINIEPSVPKVVIADEMRLSQVLTNLLSNAIKFTPEDGLITLNVAYENYEAEQATETKENDIKKANGNKKASEDKKSSGAERSGGDGKTGGAERLGEDKRVSGGKAKKDGRLIVRITDTGIGMSEEQKAKLFRPFEQAEAGTFRKYGGTGLGLAISKRLIEMMDGQVGIESRLGEGSTFYFTVSVGLGEETAAKTESEAAQCADYRGILRGIKMLLVEDIDINREIVISLLEETGIEIECAEDGLIAYEKFMSSDGEYDIIAMDIQMPRLDGLAATEKIRASCARDAHSIPIIAMTSNAFNEDVERCKEAGMNDHICKPIDFDVLIAKIKQFF